MSTIRRAAVLALAMVLAGCGGSTPSAPSPSAGSAPVGSAPAGSAPAIGTISLPSGSPLDRSELSVTNSFGSATVGSDGSFKVPAPSGPSAVEVVDGTGKIVLLGFVDHSQDSRLSAASTATVLLFWALGAFTVPGDHFAEVVGLIGRTPEAAALATTLEARLAAAPTLITDGDPEALAAVLSARDSILAATEAAAAAGLARRTGSGLDAAGSRPASVATLSVARNVGGPLAIRLAAAGPNVIIDEAVPKSGIEILANPNGPGIVAQNSRRRDVALFLYQVGSEDANGVRTDLPAPAPVGEPRPVPATRVLNVITSTLDAFSAAGRSAWAPVLSDPIDLSLIEGSTRTFYVVVAIGPTADPTNVPALFTTSRWFGQVDQWKKTAHDLGWRGFIGEHLLPVLSFGIFGSVYQVSTSRLVQFEAALRSGAERVLAARGVVDPVSLSARSKVLQTLINEAAFNASYNRELIAEVTQTVGEAELNAERIAATQARFGLLSKAGLILAIVDAVFSAADVGAVAKDLLSSSQAKSWTVTALEAAVRLEPTSGLVTKTAPSVDFRVSVKGDPNGIYLYRWSTSGRYGKVSDFLNDGLSVDSRSDRALYLVNDPASITDDLRDTLTVEVFANDPSGTIPTGASPIGKATATVTGKRASETGVGGPGFWDLTEGFDANYNRKVSCGGFYVSFPYDPAVVEYSVHISGLDPAVVGFSEQTLKVRTADLVANPTPGGKCPGVSLIRGDEVWVSLSRIEDATGPISKDKQQEIANLYKGMIVDVERRY